MSLVRVFATVACALTLAHPAFAACDIEAKMNELTAKLELTGVGMSKASDTWIAIYTPQLSEVMKAGNAGDIDTACDKLKDLSDWVDNNPPQ